MEAEKALELLEYIDPKVTQEGRGILRQVLKEDVGLGVAFSILSCAFCGEEWLLIHAIPTSFPTKCPECNRNQSYKIGEIS